MAAKMFPVAVPGEYPWPLARLRLSPTAATRSPASLADRGHSLASFLPPLAAVGSLPIAGPVIVYGVSASVLYGFIYWITTLL